MYMFSPMRSAWRVSLSVLLLLCVSSPSVHGDSDIVRVNMTIANRNYRSTSFITFMPGKTDPLEFNLTFPTKSDGFFLSFLLSDGTVTSLAPLRISVTDFVFVDSFFALHYWTGPNSVLNYTRGSFRFNRRPSEPFLYKLEPYVGPGFLLYIRDVTADINSQYKARFFGLNIYKRRTFNADTTDQGRTGVYVDNVKVTGVRSMLNRNISYYSYSRSGASEEHVDTLSVTNSVCFGCTEYFFADSATNVIQNGLVRFLNCSLTGAIPFYAPLGENRGSSVLNLAANGNLVLSNISTNGPLFGYTPNSDGVLSSTSRVTLHNISAYSLYPSPTTARLFSSVPSGAQVYVGPMTLNGVTYTTKDDYENLNLPFTRVIDVNQKVLFLAASEERAATEDNSQVNQFSASLCVNDGYSTISEQLAAIVGGVAVSKTKCNCNADRYRPHCTTTPDVLGESLCPADMSMSLTQGKCVSCKISHCARCDTADKCEACDPDYTSTQNKDECGFSLSNCKTISNEDKTKCAECNPQYDVSVTGRCVTTIPNCEKYQDDGTCLACTGDLTPSSSASTCVSCTVENCDRCDDVGMCDSCKIGYSPIEGQGCIECKVPGCILCYEANKCGLCDPGLEGCQIGGEQDTSKGIPWWVWLIVGLGSAVVVGLIIFFIVWCCCCKQKEFNVIYQEMYNPLEEENQDHDVRQWDKNGNVSGYGHGAVFMVDDNARPRIYKQRENSLHGDADSFVTSEESSLVEEDLSNPEDNSEDSML